MEFGFYERAKFLVERYGLSIIPARWGEKTPIPVGWQKFCDEKPTDGQLIAWAKGNNDKLNLSIALGKASRLIALDVDVVDPYVHQELIPFRDRLVIRHGSTGRYAYLYRFNGEQNRSISGLQLLSHGRQLVIEGLHPSGNEYKLCVDDDMDIGEALASAPFLPNGTFEAIEKYIKENITEESETKYRNKFSENKGRHTELINEAYYWACYSVQSNLDAHGIANKLIESEYSSWLDDPTEHSRGKCDKKANALKMATSALKKANERGDIYPDFDKYFSNLEVPVIEDVKEIINDQIIADSLSHKDNRYKEKMRAINKRTIQEQNNSYTPPPIPDAGLIRDIYEYGKFYHTEVPSISIAAGFGVMSQLTNMSFCTDDVNGSALILSLAPSGYGKNFAHELINDLFKYDTSVVTERPASPHAIYSQLKDVSTDLRYVIDEVDSLISQSSIKKNTSSYGTDAAGAINKTWCASFRKSQPFTLAGSKALIRENNGKILSPIYFPMISIYGSTTIEAFEAVADRKVVTAGFVNRFMVFPQDYFKKRKIKLSDKQLAEESFNKIQAKVNFIKENYKALKNEEEKDPKQAFIPIRINFWNYDEALEMISQADVDYVSKKEGRGGLSNRYEQHTLKIALLYAVSEIDEVMEISTPKKSYGVYMRDCKYEIKKHHVEYGIKLFHWMLDEVKDLYDNVSKNDSSSNTTYGERETDNFNNKLKLIVKFLAKEKRWCSEAEIRTQCGLWTPKYKERGDIFKTLGEKYPNIEHNFGKLKTNTKDTNLYRIREE